MPLHLSLADKLEQALGYVDSRVVKDVTTLHDLLDAIIKHLESHEEPTELEKTDDIGADLVARLQIVEGQLADLQQLINEVRLGSKDTAMERCFHQVEDMKDAMQALKEKTAELSDYVQWEAMQTVLTNEIEKLKEELKQSIMDIRHPTAPSGLEEMAESLKDVAQLWEEHKNLESFVRRLEVAKADREEIQKHGESLVISGPRDSAATPSSENLMHIGDLRYDLQKQQEEMQLLKKEMAAFRMMMKNTGKQDQEVFSAESMSTMQRKLQDENKKLHRTVIQLNENYLRLLEKHKSLESLVARLQEGKADRDEVRLLGGLINHTGLKDLKDSTTASVPAENLQHPCQSTNYLYLLEKHKSLESLVAQLQEGKADRDEVRLLGGLINHTGFKDLKDSTTAPAPAEILQHTCQSSTLSSTAEMMSNMQNRILQLQDESNTLHAILKQLKEELKQHQSHTDYLYSTMEVLDDKKADKGLVEMQMCTKADMLAMATMSEHMNGMFQHISDQMSGYNQNWHDMYEKLSMDMESKLNIELDPIKEQLEDQCRKLRNILKQLEAQSQQKNVAGLKKPIVERFHCISCDQPVAIKIPEPAILPGPSFPAFPYRKTNRPDLTYDMDHVRKHARGNKSTLGQEPLILSGKPQSVPKVRNFHYRPPVKVCKEMPTDITEMSTSQRMLI